MSASATAAKTPLKKRHLAAIQRAFPRAEAHQLARAPLTPSRSNRLRALATSQNPPTLSPHQVFTPTDPESAATLGSRSTSFFIAANAI